MRQKKWIQGLYVVLMVAVLTVVGGVTATNY